MLGVWFRCKHGCSLALHVLGLGFLLLWVCSRELEEGEAPLLSSSTLGRDVEQLQGRAQLLVDSELFLHLDVADAIRERRDDGLVVTLGILIRVLLKR